MRTPFIERLGSLAAADDRIWLLTGDLGYSVLESFAARFPERFVNVGICEQTMMGVAAGLALSGRIPFVYSIANFPVMRCLEQIRNDVCLHGLDVKVVSVGAGTTYGAAGYSHHAVEDVAVMRAMPGMAILVPSNSAEAAWAAEAALSRSGPVYVRLGKSTDVVSSARQQHLHFGRAITVREGRDLTLVSVGTSVGTCMRAADVLSRHGIEARVLNPLTVTPIDEDRLVRAMSETSLLMTVEEHGPVGGLHSAVLDALSGTSTGRCLRVSLSAEPATLAGSSTYLATGAGIDAGVLAAKVMAQLAEVRH